MLDTLLESALAGMEKRANAAPEGPYTTDGGMYIGISAMIDGVSRQIGRAETFDGRLSCEQVEAVGELFASCRTDIPKMTKAIRILAEALECQYKGEAGECSRGLNAYGVVCINCQALCAAREALTR